MSEHARYEEIDAVWVADADEARRARLAAWFALDGMRTVRAGDWLIASAGYDWSILEAMR